MDIKDLSREQLLLLNTDFGEEIEKVAEAYVEEEYEKVAEMEEVASACMAYGAELAMQKIAEMEANHQEKIAQEEKKEEKKGLEKEEEEEEEESEEEKNASAMGQFILEGYWNTMMEKGAEYYGDQNIYIEELCKEAKLGRVDRFMRSLKSGAKKAKTKASRHLKKHKGKYQAGGLAAGAYGAGEYDS